MSEQVRKDEERDAMLMAYVDGELDAGTAAEVTRALAADPAQAARAEEFRRSRRLAREAFAGVLGRPAPARLSAALAPARVLPLVRRAGVRISAPLLALAATLLLVAALGGYLVGRGGEAPGDGGLLASGGALRSALESQPSGRDLELPDGERLRIVASYPVAGDICRAFALVTGQAGLRGLACRDDGGWPVTLAVSDPGVGAFAPASDSAAGSLDAWLDGRGALPALSAEDELQALTRGWAE